MAASNPFPPCKHQEVESNPLPFESGLVLVTYFINRICPEECSGTFETRSYESLLFLHGSLRMFILGPLLLRTQPPHNENCYGEFTCRCSSGQLHLTGESAQLPACEGAMLGIQTVGPPGDPIPNCYLTATTCKTPSDNCPAEPT